MIVDSIPLLDTLKEVTDSVAILNADSLPILDNVLSHPIPDDVLPAQWFGGLWSALLIFLMGLFADAIVRNRIKRRSLIIMRETIVFWYEKEAASLEKNINSIGAMGERINNAVLFQPEATMIHDVDLARLTEFRLDELFSAFVGNMKDEQDKKLKYLYCFQKSCRYITLTIAEVRKMHENYVDDVRALMEELNAASKHLQNELLAFPDTSALTQWHKLCDDCKSKGGGDQDNMDIEKWNEFVIMPFIEFASENYYKVPQTIVPDLRAMNVVFLKFRATRKYGQLFMDYAKNMKASAVSLKESVTFLKSVKMKHWVH